MPANASLLPNWIGISPASFATCRSLSNSASVVGTVRPRSVELLLVVVDADDLAHRREPVEVAGAELLAVRAPAADRHHVVRHAVVPAVRLRVVVERQEQSRLDELPHVGPTLVRLHDVGAVGTRHGELQERLEFTEVAVDALDRHVRVLRLELRVQLIPDLADRAAFLVPHRERDGPGLGDAGVHRSGGSGDLAGRPARGTGHGDRGERQDRQEETGSWADRARGHRTMFLPAELRSGL